VCWPWTSTAGSVWATLISQWTTCMGTQVGVGVWVWVSPSCHVRAGTRELKTACKKDRRGR
jgi:hypothetical protein